MRRTVIRIEAKKLIIGTCHAFSGFPRKSLKFIMEETRRKKAFEFSRDRILAWFLERNSSVSASTIRELRHPRLASVHLYPHFDLPIDHHRSKPFRPDRGWTLSLHPVSPLLSRRIRLDDEQSVRLLIGCTCELVWTFSFMWLKNRLLSRPTG